MGGPERDPPERGRHHQQFQDFHQDPFPGAGRVHGSCKAGGANAGRNIADVLGGTSSKRQSQGHKVRHQLFHQHRPGRNHRRPQVSSQVCPKTYSGGSSHDEKRNGKKKDRRDRSGSPRDKRKDRRSRSKSPEKKRRRRSSSSSSGGERRRDERRRSRSDERRRRSISGDRRKRSVSGER